MATSYQQEIPPARVNIRLSVETGNDTRRQELPLKLLVLGSFRTAPDSRRLAEREKFAVHRENFDAVLRSMNLRLNMTVKNCIDTSTDTLPVQLEFDSIRAFEPEQIVAQVPVLGRLLAARNLIRDLGSNLMDNRAFRKELEALLRDKIARKSLHEDLRDRVRFQGESL